MSWALLMTGFAFAWSMGAHYTGACMGMAYATRRIRAMPALAAMAGFTLVGAALFSHGVLGTVSRGLLDTPVVAPSAALTIVACAFALTTIFNARRIPTSTIQILVFAAAGVARASGVGVHWATIGQLAAVWAVAPPAAMLLGYAGVRLLPRRSPAGTGVLARALVGAGLLASVAMGANDVANATGFWVGAHLVDPGWAGVLGGLGLALGALTWGRPLLERVAFDVVSLDDGMAAVAQAAQAVVVLTAVAFGCFTSMNQALVGAMAGAGLARGRETVRWPAVRGILIGWLVGPAAGFGLGWLGASIAALWTG